jgi:tetratricopeptide (TPR) repeat protein
MKYRNIVLIAFVVLVGVSLIYGLADHRTVTTTSEKAYEAYQKGKDYSYRLYESEALQEFERAAQLDPNFAMAYASMAMLYKNRDRKNDYETAKAKALSLLNQVTDKERIQIDLGFAGADNRHDDMVKYADELLKKYPQSFEAHEYLSGKYFTEKNYDKAIEENLIILKKDPNHVVSYNLLGYSYFYKGEYDKALQYIEKYSKLAEDQANPHDSHGELLLDLGRYDEALLQFQKADSIKPGLSFVMAHIGDTYFAKGMYRDAADTYLKAKDLWPAESFKAEMDDNIAWCYILRGQLDKASALLAEVVSRVPDNIKAYDFIGAIYAYQGNIDNAKAQLAVIKNIIKKYNETHPGGSMEKVPPDKGQDYLTGRIEMAKGDFKSAIDSFKKMCGGIGLPEKTYFTSQLGEAYVRANMPDSAIDVLTNALKDNPNDGFCLKILAEAYHLNGQKEAEKGALMRYLTVMKDADDGLPSLREANTELQNINSGTS